MTYPECNDNNKISPAQTGSGEKEYQLVSKITSSILCYINYTEIATISEGLSHSTRKHQAIELEIKPP
jgi:hypothetical protein